MPIAQSLLTSLVVVCLFGCADEARPPVEPSARQSASPREKKPPRRMKPLSPGQVRRVMDAKATDISGCYELSDKGDSALESLTVEFEVGVDGRVNGERIAESGGAGGVLESCILGVVRAARFPKAGSPTDVSWPLRFRTARP